MAQSKAIGIARGDAIGVLATVAATLGAITVTSPTITNAVGSGATAFATAGRTAGSTLTMIGAAPTSNFLNINSATGNVVGGTNAPLTGGSQTGTYLIVETLAGAIGSPRTSGPFASITVGAVAPANTALPVISGTPQVGVVLSVSNGIWTNNPTGYTYQWFVAGVQVSTTATYTPVSGDATKLANCIVTATNAGGSATATAASVGPISAAAAALNGLTVAWGTITDQLAPGTQVGTISGATTGSSLTMTGAAFSGGALAVNSTGRAVVIGVSGPLAFVASTGVGALVETLAGASNSPNSSAFASQTVTTTRPISTALPTLAGSAAQGSTLTATPGTYTNSPTSFTRQFLSGATVVATNVLTYVAQASDAGASITFTEIAVNAGGQSAPNGSPAVSNAIGPVAAGSVPSTTTAPTIAGSGATAKDNLFPGQVLTATPGTYTGAPTSYARQWNRGATNIAGATALTYTMVNADLGQSITFVEIPTNGVGAGPAATSNALKIGELFAGFNVADGTSVTNGAPYTSESAHVFTPSGGVYMITGKKLFNSSGTYRSDMIITAPLSVADCFVQAQISITTQANNSAYIGLRATASKGNAYWCGLEAGVLTIYKVTAGVPPTLGTALASTSFTWPSGTSHLIRFEAIGGASTVLNIYSDGVLKLTATDSASPYTAAGRVQFYGNNGSGQVDVYNFANLTAGAA